MSLKKINKNAQGVPTGEYTDVAGSTLYADVGIGTILPYGGASDKIPQGYLLCDGTSLLRASYPELFAVIGTAFGSADSTHFNIPDLREATTKGIGENPNGEAHVKSGGLSLGEFQDDRVEVRANTNFVIVTEQSTGRGLAGNPSVWGDTFKGRIGATTEVKSVGVNYIIKAVQVALPADLASGVEEYIDENATSPVSVSNKLVTESDLNKAITVTTPNNNIVIADSRLITDNLVMVSGYIKSGTQLAFNTSQVKIGNLSVSGRTIRGSAPCSLFLFSNDLFGINGPNTIQAIWKTAQGWLTIGRDVTNSPKLSEDAWFTAMLPLE